MIIEGTLPINATMKINFTEEKIQKAMEEFENTVIKIEDCKANGNWPGPSQPPPEETCAACDIRWKCATAINLGRRYEMMHP